MGERLEYIFECDIPGCKTEHRKRYSTLSARSATQLNPVKPHGWETRRFKKDTYLLCPGHIDEWERISHGAMRVLFRDAKEESNEI